MPITTLLMGSLAGGAGGGSGQGIANIAGGLISGIAGIGQKRKAKKMLANLGEQPTYNIPQEVLNNQKMAELSAQEGMPSQQYNNAMKNIQRTQSGLLAGATDRRSALMALPRIQQQSNDALGNLDARDATMRQQNQQTLYGVGNTTAQYRDKSFNINQLQPWQRKYNYGMQLLGAGNQNFTSGLDKITGGAGMLLGGGLFGKGKGKSNANNTNSGQSYVPDGVYMDGDPGNSSNV